MTETVGDYCLVFFKIDPALSLDETEAVWKQVRDDYERLYGTGEDRGDYLCQGDEYGIGYRENPDCTKTGRLIDGLKARTEVVQRSIRTV